MGLSLEMNNNEYLKFLRKNPSNYVEELYGIKLLPNQKLFLNCMDKIQNSTAFVNCKKQRYRYLTYLMLCMKLVGMKDDDTIAILNPSGNKILNKKEFTNWLKNEYWR